MERLLEQLSIHSGSRSLINAVTEVWRAPINTPDSQTCALRELVVMSQFETFDPARLVLYMPTCEKCGAKMWLVRIEPDAPGHDRRCFQCPQCENVATEIVKYR